ncbi:hypothetical protein [Desulfonatronum parangueonense]
MDGIIKHRRVDKGSGSLPEALEENGHIHARFAPLSSITGADRLGGFL